MPSDYPDYTSLMQIIGSDIMIPIDIQGAYIMMPMDLQASYIMMPVDIQAQYVTLDVDITAQTVGNIGIDIKAQTIGNLAVNIAASAVTLNVDIKAQTIANLKINIDAQTVGVYLQPEWSALQGIDKNFYISGVNKGWSDGGFASYTVPAGKTLYITNAVWVAYAYAQANADLNQMSELQLMNWTDNIQLARIGGNGGGIVTFPKPVKITAGKAFYMYVTCWANHALTLLGCVNGYEV